MRQPKVNDKRATVIIHQQISRFQVTVDNPVLMGILHRTTHAQKQVEALWDGECVALGIGRQRLPTAHQFHGHIGESFVRIRLAGPMCCCAR
jgi:hypothetical protein